jgi:NADH/NAD ratio-sensing transcriptional regulator Rex
LAALKGAVKVNDANVGELPVPKPRAVAAAEALVAPVPPLAKLKGAVKVNDANVGELPVPKPRAVAAVEALVAPVPPLATPKVPETPAVKETVLQVGIVPLLTKT